MDFQICAYSTVVLWMSRGTETRYWNHICDFSEMQLVHTSSLWTIMHVRIEPTCWTTVLRGKIFSTWTGRWCLNPMGCLGCNRKMSCSPPASTEDTSTSPRCSLWGMGTAACRALEAPYREHATALLGMCSNHTAQHHHCYCGGNR